MGCICYLPSAIDYLLCYNAHNIITCTSAQAFPWFSYGDSIIVNLMSLKQLLKYRGTVYTRMIFKIRLAVARVWISCNVCMLYYYAMQHMQAGIANIGTISGIRYTKHIPIPTTPRVLTMHTYSKFNAIMLMCTHAWSVKIPPKHELLFQREWPEVYIVVTICPPVWVHAVNYHCFEMSFLLSLSRRWAGVWLGHE